MFIINTHTRINVILNLVNLGKFEIVKVYCFKLSNTFNMWCKSRMFPIQDDGQEENCILIQSICMQIHLKKKLKPCNTT